MNDFSLVELKDRYHFLTKLIQKVKRKKKRSPLLLQYRLSKKITYLTKELMKVKTAIRELEEENPPKVDTLKLKDPLSIVPAGSNKTNPDGKLAYIDKYLNMLNIKDSKSLTSLSGVL